MRLISQPHAGYPYRNGKRVEHVTRQEWEELFAPFPAEVRGHMANLAAHNWYIVYAPDRIGALTPSAYSGHWMLLDGTRVPMTEAEQNAFFPVAPDSSHGQMNYATVYPSSADGVYRKRIVRQREIVIPVSAQQLKYEGLL